MPQPRFCRSLHSDFCIGSNEINPEAYLRDTLAKIAEGYPINRIVELMPWAYQPATA